MTPKLEHWIISIYVYIYIQNIICNATYETYTICFIYNDIICDDMICNDIICNDIICNAILYVYVMGGPHSDIRGHFHRTSAEFHRGDNKMKCISSYTKAVKSSSVSGSVSRPVSK